MHDACQDGRELKVPTVEDEFTRRCLAIEVERRMPASAVCRVLLRLFGEHGTPSFVRSDNGPEFIATALVKVLAANGVACRHIDPGSPWQNGLNERFNGSLRDECLNLETFAHRDQARAVCRLFMRHYNHERPHSALEYLTPDEFAARCGRHECKKNKGEDRGCAAGGGGAAPRKTPRPQKPLSSVAGTTTTNDVATKNHAHRRDRPGSAGTTGRRRGSARRRRASGCDPGPDAWSRARSWHHRFPVARLHLAAPAASIARGGETTEEDSSWAMR